MTSTKNVIERFWPELNSRVNYLVKRTLISIIYWREWLQYARFLVQWGFIPIKNMRLSQQNALLNKVFVPSTFEAFKMYEELGGNLSRNTQNRHRTDFHKLCLHIVIIHYIISNVDYIYCVNFNCVLNIFNCIFINGVIYSN